MHPFRILSTLACFSVLSFGSEPSILPGVGKAMEQMIEKNEIAGAVTVVLGKDRILHKEATGYADVASKRPMSEDTVFWIASMTKPVTAVAVMMLYDEGKLKPSD